MFSSSTLGSTLFSLKKWNFSRQSKQVLNVVNRLPDGNLGKTLLSFLARGLVIARKDAKIYYFKPQIFGFGILIPAFVYLSFSLGREMPSSLLVPGLVGMVSLFGASSIEAISIPIEKQTETYELLQIAPVSTRTIVFGKSLAGSAFGIVLSLGTALVAILLTLSNVANVPLFILATIIGAFTFSAFGMLVAAAANDMPTANMSLTALRLPMIFISGVFIPVQSLPLPLQVVSYLSPLTYVVNALRDAMLAPSIIFALNIGVLLTLLIAFQTLAVAVLSKKTQS
jgi:ABC-2 type transport system permease protein